MSLSVSEFKTIDYAFRVTDAAFTDVSAEVFTDEALVSLATRNEAIVSKLIQGRVAPRQKALRDLTLSMRRHFREYQNNVLNPLSDTAFKANRLKYSMLEDKIPRKPFVTRARLALQRRLARNSPVSFDAKGAGKRSIAQMESYFVKRSQARYRAAMRKAATLPKAEAKVLMDKTTRLINHQSQTVMRTAAQQTIAISDQEAMKDVYKRYIYSAVMDDRTTERCRSLNGKTFPVGKGPLPPQHYNCRSSIYPAPDGEVKRRQMKAASRSSYKRWLKSRTPETQNKILGKKRAGMLRKGQDIGPLEPKYKAKVSRFVKKKDGKGYEKLLDENVETFTVDFDKRLTKFSDKIEEFNRQRRLAS